MTTVLVILATRGRDMISFRRKKSNFISSSGHVYFLNGVQEHMILTLKNEIVLYLISLQNTSDRESNYS